MASGRALCALLLSPVALLSSSVQGLLLSPGAVSPHTPMEAGSLRTGPGRCLFCKFWEDLFRRNSICLKEPPSPAFPPVLSLRLQHLHGALPLSPGLGRAGVDLRPAELAEGEELQGMSCPLGLQEAEANGWILGNLV